MPKEYKIEKVWVYDKNERELKTRFYIKERYLSAFLPFWSYVQFVTGAADITLVKTRASFPTEQMAKNHIIELESN